MSVDKALKELMIDEFKKLLSKMRYKIDARIVGVNEITKRITLAFPPYIGLKLKVKEKSGAYFCGRIIDVEWDNEMGVFNVICEPY